MPDTSPPVHLHSAHPRGARALGRTLRLALRVALPLVVVTVAGAGEIPTRGVGVRLSALGDLDGDGKPEFAAATRGSSAQVVIVSAATGKELWRTAGHDAAALADQDGDGKPDVVIASRFDGRSGWAAVCKGADGAQIGAVAPKGGDTGTYNTAAAFSDSVAVLPDADGDGKPDLLIVRALPAGPSQARGLAALLPAWCTSAEAFVVGLDGKLIADLDAQSDADIRSPIAVSAGDADGDGRTDVIVCVPWERFSVPIELRSLAKGVITRFKGDSGPFPPPAIAPCGDFDGDKAPDFLLGIPRSSRANLERVGAVRVVSGKDGHEIRSVRGAKEGDELGSAVAAVPDLDGDGVPEFVAGAPGTEPKKGQTQTGAVTLYSGKTGKALWTVKGEAQFECFGEAVAVIADADGDGASDVVAGAPGFGPTEKGLVRVLSGKTGKLIATHAGK